MQAAMDRLERAIARRRRLVLVVWLAIVVISVPFAGRQTENLTGGGFETKGSGSKVVGDALTRDFGLQSEDLAVVFDNDVVARGLSEAARAHGLEIPFLVECDTGFGRNGVQTPEAALELARSAMAMPGLRFEGLMTFPNREPATRVFLEQALERFKRAGIAVPVVSGGGTPALATLADYPMMTEHRAGTYVFNDVMMMHSGVAGWDDCAMHVRATVVSRPTEDRAIVDAGSKVLTRERYYVENFGRVVEYPDAVVSNLSEEHGMIDLSSSATKPRVGEVVNIIPNHACVVTNMVDELYGLRAGRVEVVWPVAARGKVR